MEIGQKIKPGQHAVVIGLGISGRAMLEFLLSREAQVSVSDRRVFSALPQEDQEYLKKNDISFESGGHSKEFLSRGDFVAISPGVSTDLPLLNELREEHIPILGELALAAPYITECVVAVTGTNGKTTVTALIGELLRASGKKVFVGGNIGTPVLNYLLGDERADYLVLELSSFQLESAGSFCPHIGVLLNITPDHLDRHGSMVNYAAAKMKMFVHQKADDKAILCSDDPMCLHVRELLNGQEVYCFGNPASNCAATGNDRKVCITLPDRTDSYELAGTKLDSHTGMLNSCAAILAVSLLGCEKNDIANGLKYFAPADHRLQHVRLRKGVDYYNDSKATNTGAVISALCSFSKGVILIAGGRDKGEDYTVLKEFVLEKVEKLILIGEAAGAIADAMEGTVPVLRADSMEDAVSLAADSAQPGEIVLLAPACSSFDMFDNYGHRGEVFMQAVLALNDDEGRRV
ncbi:UDP-N-acetylmuramoylalanine--D-glutamate ligase [Desulfocapsa sulfexigens DSM 10523]|uniref:UDP-N-acetylmuramoylalanine--D-glutamate ligase n=1 Tax=Desulfocapsa sulfexigens (strain DSM 10523 / SB164P1) TaxID=1167006 RepID=M1P989_DESSD|nr:UDP-N-acetylmuramoyl-L-alanine--D-glutamate ligase [Desulfocapsa sulfexigens]AGF80003.1 UDP-N-acetylmuramoylalanine--D-glutamate ligase [Desulfocapsa sulfexigens DSM 10523]